MRGELKTIVLLSILLLVTYVFASGVLTGYLVWWEGTPGFVINETSHFDNGTNINTAASQNVLQLDNTTPTSYYSSGNWTSDNIIIGINKMLKNMTIKYSLNRTEQIDDSVHNYKEYGIAMLGSPSYPAPDSMSWTAAFVPTQGNLASPDGVYQSKSVIASKGNYGYVFQLFEFDIKNAISGNITWKGYGEMSGGILPTALRRFHIWNETKNDYDVLWSFSNLNIQTTQDLTQSQITDAMKNGKLYFMAMVYGQTASSIPTIYSDYIQLELTDGTIDRVEWLDSGDNIVAYDDNDVNGGFSAFYDSNNIDSGNLSYLNTSTMKIKLILTGTEGSTPIIDDIIVYYEDMPASPNNPPTITLISPEDLSSGISTAPELLVLVTDQDNDLLNVYFYDQYDNLIGSNLGLASGSTATATWPGLSNDVTYMWYVIVSDGTDTTQSNIFIFDTSSAIVYGGGGGGLVIPKDTKKEIEVIPKEITITTKEIYSIVNEEIDAWEGIGITNEGEEEIEVSIKVVDGGLLQVDKEIVKIAANTTETIEIKTSVLEGTEPGEYKGKIVISVDGVEKIVDVTTVVEALPEQEPVAIIKLIEYSYEKRIEIIILKLIFEYFNIPFE